MSLSYPDEFYGQQTKSEWDWWLEQIKGSQSILEIGSCWGYTLEMMADFCPGALIRSIDWCGGGGPWEGQAIEPALRKVIERLREKGHDAEMYVGRSQDHAAIMWADQWAPYDAIFIDADHSYSGVSSDWNCYGHMGRIVGFHDINDMVNPGRDEVRVFWDEVKGNHVTKEVRFANQPGLQGHGIGIIFND